VPYEGNYIVSGNFPARDALREITSQSRRARLDRRRREIIEVVEYYWSSALRSSALPGIEQARDVGVVLNLS
jgi:hypothetical protein